jgi:tetratricopeptide (TPR) repeat protein
VARLAGRPTQAQHAAQQALALARRHLPAGHPLALLASAALGRAALAAGERGEALRWLQHSVDGRVALAGEQHPALGDDLLLAARIRAELNDHARALSLYQAAARIHSQAYGTEHEKVAIALAGAALAFRGLGRPRDAAHDYEQALRIWRALGDGPNAALARALKDAAMALIDLGRPPPRALEYLREAEEIDHHLLGPDHVQVAIDLHLFGRFHAARGEHALAYDYQQRAYERLLELFGPEDRRVKNANATLQATVDAMGAQR